MRLVTKGHPALSEVSTPVNMSATYRHSTLHVIELMWETVRKHGGVGLAANQIAITKRIIVINTKKTKLTVINPEITRTWNKTLQSHEGCLSFPGLMSTMRRYRTVKLEGFSEEGNPISLKLTGLDAIVAQHEIDHLNGVTIDD